MKFLWSALLLAGAVVLGGAENLIVNPTGSENFKGFWKHPKAPFSSAEGVILLKGSPDAGESNGYLKAQQNIAVKPEAIRGKTFVLSFKAKADKISGSCQIAIRETLAKGGTYHGFFLKKWDVSPEWKEYKKEFTVRPDSSALSLYLIAAWLNGDDEVRIKDLSLTEK